MNAAKHREIASEAAALCEPVHFYSTKFNGPLRPRAAMIVGGHPDANVFAVAVFAGPDDDGQPVTVHNGVPLFEDAAKRSALNPHCDTWCLPIEASREFLSARHEEAEKNDRIAREQTRRLAENARQRAEQPADTAKGAKKGKKDGEQGAESPGGEGEGDKKSPPQQ